MTFEQWKKKVFKLAKNKGHKLPSGNILYMEWERGNTPESVVLKYCK